MASGAVTWWLDKTVLIHNEWGGKGTGFFVVRTETHEDPGYGSLFVVTNKHVINKDPALRSAATAITLGVNVRRSDGELAGEQLHCDLHYPGGAPLWREHPEDDVDVLAVDVGAVIFPRSDIEYTAPHWEGASNYEIFADAMKIAEHEIAAGDEVFVAGYPMGIRQGRTNSPLVRRGIIASRIGELLEEDILDPDDPTIRIGTRRLRGFLVDGGL
jgi:hypothetical protein